MNRLKDLIRKYFSSFAFFFRYLRYRMVYAFLITMVVSVLDGLGLSMFFPLLQVVGSDKSASPSSMGNLRFLMEGIQKMGISLTLSSVLSIMLLFFVLKGVVTYLSSIYNVNIQQAFIRDLRLDSLTRLNKLSFKYFITSDSGRIQNTMSGEVGKLSGAYSFYSYAFQAGSMTLVYMAFAFFMDPQFALLVTIGGALTNLLYRIIYKKTKGYSRKLTNYNNIFQGQLIQHVANFKYLKATGLVDQYGQKLEDTIYKVESSTRKIGMLNSITIAAREPLLIAIIAIVIYIQFTYFGGQMGAILITLLFFYRALTFLVGMQQNWNGFVTAIGSLENMTNFLRYLDSGREKTGKIPFKTFEKNIQLKDVAFSYGETSILKNINLEIPKNKSIAFVGESGSGKTTLVSLLAGLLPETAGKIQVDTLSLKEINKSTYQSRIGYISQDPVIFNDTIFNNISFWANPSAQTVERVRKVVQEASLTPFIASLPNGLETELGNNGINLSGGQKQRISIARELYKDVDILILDEATSALDSQTEKEIQTNIDSLKGKYTLIIIAHRLSTIKNVDKVYVMDQGEIIAEGSFEELTKRSEKFKKMVELQEI